LSQPELAIVVWSGTLGGAETFSAALAKHIARRGAGTTLVSVTDLEPLARSLGTGGPQPLALNYGRGREIVFHARAYARALSAVGPDGALLMAPGYLAWALRAGGYTGRIVAVEHGELLREMALPRVPRALRIADRALSARVIDTEVAVSEYMLEHLTRAPHARDLRCIPNGIDTSEFSPTSPSFLRERTTLGWAGRLVPGKGVDKLIAAVTRRPWSHDIEVFIAGEGPERTELQGLAAESNARIHFVGPVQDMPAFWNRCDVALALSDSFVESFGMAPLEAAACGRAVIATDNGGFLDVVEDSTTGTIVPRGDVELIADALERYIGDKKLAQAHGRAARMRAQRTFGLETCADRYLKIFSNPS
jgi:glycosyltransferase involved in cell wall biosynthesis